MKKGDRVYINSSILKPAARQGSWTESNLYGNIVLKAGTIVYHVSERKLEGFAPVETCFSLNGVCELGYVYAMELKKDMTFEHFDTNDYRIDLNSVSNDDIEIYYVGTVQYDLHTAIVDKYSRIQGRFKIFNFCDRFKELQKELQTEGKKETGIDSYHQSLGWHIEKEK